MALFPVTDGSADVLSSQLLRAERGRVRVLLPNPDPESRSKSDAEIVALFLPERGKRRRRWRLLQSLDSGAPGEVGRPPKLDAAIVCISHGDLDVAGPAATARDVATASAIGQACERFRLRRTAIAVLDCPPDRGPRDATQVSCAPCDAPSLREAVGAYAARHGDGSGSPVADPVWREFLETTIAGNPRLTGLYETLRHVTGRVPPLFLFSDAVRPAEIALPVLDWIDGRAVDRGRRRGRWISVASSVALSTSLMLVLVGATLPAGNAARLAGIASESVSSRVRVIESRVAPYAWSARLIPGGARGEAPLRRALAAARAQSRIEDLAADRASFEATLRSLRAEAADRARLLDAEVARVASRLAGADANARAEASRGLTELAGRASTELEAWRVSRVPPGEDADVGEAWRDSIARAFVASILAGTECGDAGWGRVLPLDASRASIRVLDSVGYPETSRALAAAAEADSGAVFLERYVSASRDDPILAGVPGLASFLPRPDLAGAIAAIASKSDMSVLEDPAGSEATLRAVVQIGDTALPDGGSLDGEAAARAREMILALRALGAPREVVVRFSRAYDDAWHLDLLPPGGRGVIPAQWVPGDGAEGCLARIVLAPGASIRLRLQQRSAVHVVVGAESNPCTDARATTVRIKARSGSFEIDGKRIEYEIVDGWPAWPPTKAA